MTQTAAKPAMSWDEEETVQGEEFALADEAAEVPKACSIDNPECEACQ